MHPLKNSFRYGLGIDTSLAGISICITDFENPDADISIEKPMARGQAEYLMPVITNALTQSGVSYSDLDVILTTRGPGAFTGLRVGLSAAKAFGLSLNIPVYGIDTLTMMAASYLFDADHLKTDGFDIIFTVLETKRRDYYILGVTPGLNVVQSAASMSLDQVVEVSQYKKCMFLGDAVDRLSSEIHGREEAKNWFFEPECFLIDPVVMGRCFKQSFNIKHREEIFWHRFVRDPDPLYLRGADVSQSKRVQRVLK